VALVLFVLILFMVFLVKDACTFVFNLIYFCQGHRSHRIIGEGGIKEDWDSGGRKSPSEVQGRSPVDLRPPEAEAFL